MQTSLLLLSILLLFFAVAQIAAAVACFALYSRVTSVSSLEERVASLEQAYKTLRAAKANAARGRNNQPNEPLNFPANRQQTEDELDAQMLREIAAAGGE